MNFYAIIVVYNQFIQDSLSYQSVKEEKQIKLIVCDNSTKDYKNKEIVEKDGYTYISMHGNQGLSKAYNAALNSIKEKEGYVIIMDDDTHFDTSYYQALYKECGSADILLPIVQSQAEMMSPCILHNGIARAAENIDFISKDEMSAINSGMCISLKLFENYRYDENLFLDYVDHKFINDFRDKAMIKVMDVKIQQNFSSETNSKESAKIRFKIFLKDSQYFYLTYLKNKKSYQFVVNKRKARLLLQYKDISFLKG